MRYSGIITFRTEADVVITLETAQYTAVPQLVEDVTYNRGVDGSIPSGSTNSPWTRRMISAL